MNLRISSPCPKSWDELRGDDRVRYCEECHLNVYNLADMSREEVERLVKNSPGRLCGRLYLRGDRTATLRDCPSYRRSLVLRRAGAVAVVLALGAFAWIFRGMAGPDRSALPGWVRAVADVIDPLPQNPAPACAVGIIVPSRPPAPPAPTPPRAAN